MEKVNISLQMVITIRDIFIKDLDRVRVNIFGQIKVVTKEIGKQIRWKVTENIQHLMELLLRVGFKMISLSDDDKSYKKIKF